MRAMKTVANSLKVFHKTSNKTNRLIARTLTHEKISKYNNMHKTTNQKVESVIRIIFKIKTLIGLLIINKWILRCWSFSKIQNQLIIILKQIRMKLILAITIIRINTNNQVMWATRLYNKSKLKWIWQRFNFQTSLKTNIYNCHQHPMILSNLFRIKSPAKPMLVMGLISIKASKTW